MLLGGKEQIRPLSTPPLITRKLVSLSCLLWLSLACPALELGSELNSLISSFESLVLDSMCYVRQ